MATSLPTTAGAAPHTVKRRVRNYLLDARFQLKFTAYIVAITMIVASVLGVYLWRNTLALLRETELAVDARSKTADISRELSNSALLNQISQKGDDPAFAAQIEKESAKIDRAYEAERQAVVKARADLIQRQKLGGFVLFGAMALFIVVIALATIVTTHKIVGPLFRIKRMVSEIADGRLNVPTYPLRDGDELKDLFEMLTRMVHGLRDTSANDLASLEQALRRAEQSGLAPEVASEFRAVAERIRTRLGQPQQPAKVQQQASGSRVA